MSSVELLDNTRRLNFILHKKSNGKVVFNDICSVLSQTLCGNVFVFSKKGKLLGLGKDKNVQQFPELSDAKVSTFIDSKLNERFLSVLSTKENVYMPTLGLSDDVASQTTGIITPIIVSGERFGTLFIYRDVKNAFSLDDIIMCEYGATVVGLEMMRSVSEEMGEEARLQATMKNALATLSTSEIDALIHIFDELSGCEGILVASRIAQKAGITRSVIVNALRKLESAQIIESKSSGMKGTYIKVINPMLFEELREMGNN